MNPFNAQLDHIVIAAPTLGAGVQWCEKTLGVSPGPGGEHPHMGTHNRLLRITSEAFQGAYLEIIAIAPHMPAPAAQARWFDLDNPVLQQRLQTSGPQLVNWVASVGPGQIQNAVSQWRGLGIDAGEPTAVSRMTPTGELRWQFSIRDDGQRPANGALPHLIEWASGSPVHNMPPSPIALRRLTLTHPSAPLQAALDVGHLSPISVASAVQDQTPTLCAELDTPRGLVSLQTAFF